MNIIQKVFENGVWTIRFVLRNMEKRKLKKRIRELEISRDKWKNKAMARQARIEEIEKRNREVENELKKN